MPDRYGDRDSDAYIAAEAIAQCRLCDPSGYIGGTVCDHIDHAEAAKRGMAMVRHAMGWPEK